MLNNRYIKGVKRKKKKKKKKTTECLFNIVNKNAIFEFDSWGTGYLNPRCLIWRH